MISYLVVLDPFLPGKYCQPKGKLLKPQQNPGDQSGFSRSLPVGNNPHDAVVTRYSSEPLIAQLLALGYDQLPAMRFRNWLKYCLKRLLQRRLSVQLMS